MIGISTTYFALQGKDTYSSVSEANSLGFELAELGAMHNYQPNIESVLKKIKSDFPSMKFTIHGLFPPQKKKFWFNPSEGLTTANKKTVENFFSAATSVEAELVSFHPGFTTKAEWQAHSPDPLYGREIPKGKAMENAFRVFALAEKLSEDCGIKFAIENIIISSRPLFAGAKDFSAAFEKFRNCGLLLDYGHALFSENLEEMLSLHKKILQVHVHYSFPLSSGNKDDNHLPIESLEQLEPLSCISRLGEILLVFEHGPLVQKEKVSAEKALLELFLSERRKKQGCCF